MSVLIVGGYGAVGAAATRELAARLPGRVVVAGRDPQRARRLAASTGSAGARRVDVTDVAGFERVLVEDRISIVVLCVEPPDAAITKACIASGVHLVDVGASWPMLEQVEQLDRPAADRGVTALLSVGLAPGLTNLLARRAVDELGGADRVDIAVLLGAGERHGADAVRWTVAGLAEPTPAGARPQRVVLPGFGSDRPPVPVLRPALASPHPRRPGRDDPARARRRAGDCRPVRAARCAPPRRTAPAWSPPADGRAGGRAPRRRPVRRARRRAA